MSDTNENVIEFLRNQNTATVCFCQQRYVSKIKNLAEKFPNECQIIAENRDGSIVAHIPTEWVRISPKRQVEISDERKQELRERLSNARRNTTNT